MKVCDFSFPFYRSFENSSKNRNILQKLGCFFISFSCPFKTGMKVRVSYCTLTKTHVREIAWFCFPFLISLWNFIEDHIFSWNCVILFSFSNFPLKFHRRSHIFVKLRDFVFPFLKFHRKSRNFEKFRGFLSSFLISVWHFIENRKMFNKFCVFLFPCV